MQDEINELLKQIDSLNEELSSYSDTRSKIFSIMGRITSTKNKIKKLKSNTMEYGQEERLFTPNNSELIISKKETRKVRKADLERMKKDGVYEKYTSPTLSVEIKEKQTRLDDFDK